MGVFYFLLLSCLGLAITAQAQNCTRPIGGPNMDLKGSDIQLQTFPDGIKVTFVCDVGYVSAGGSGSITCTAGNWNPVRLKCERFNCGPGREVENGYIDYPEGTEFGDKMVIHCNPGYTLVGKGEMYCGPQGWLGRLPVCEVVTCDPPPPFVNGAFSPNTDTYQYREVVQYRCENGYTLNGSKSISCSDDGKFKPDPPTCIKVNCEDIEIANGEWVRGSRPPYGYMATVTLKCNTGYEMKGEHTQTCGINSQWSPGLPTCTKTVTPTKAPPPTTTTTSTTTTTTARPYSTKKPTAPPGPDVPDSGNNLARSLGIAFGVIAFGALTITALWWFGVPGFKKRKKRGTRNDYSEAAKEGEGIALS